jgi:hypothetical protein
MLVAGTVRCSLPARKKDRRGLWRAGVGLNPLKDFDLTEGQTFGIPSARLGIPSDRLGFPSAQLGIPSAQLGNGSLRPGEAAAPRIAFGSRQEEAGLGVTFSSRVTHNSLKSPDSREKNRVKIVSWACLDLRDSRRGRVPTLHQSQTVVQLGRRRKTSAPSGAGRGARG